MRSSSFVSFRFLAFALTAGASLLACAQGSDVGELGFGFGGSASAGIGGAGTGKPATGTTTRMSTSASPDTSSTSPSASTGSFPAANASSTNNATTGAFPAANSTTGAFPAANSTTSGFPTAASSTSGVGVTSSGGPSSACDTGDCTTCQQCAQCNTCVNQVITCELIDLDCSSILCCTAGCAQGDTQCINDCISFYPAGEQDYLALVSCVVCSCQQTCAVPAGTCP